LAPARSSASALGAVRDRVQAWLEHPESAGVLTDFDGTISPIVDRPDTAIALPGVTEVLVRLAARYARVAVISGRPVAYLVDRLSGGRPGREREPIELERVGLERVGLELVGLELVGLYGLERLRGGQVVELEEAGPWRAVVAAVADEARASAPAGVLVEPKGLTVTLHVRAAPEQARWVEEFAADQARRRGLAVHPGKLSVELRPPIEVDKGTVVAALAEDLAAVCYLGDDRGDLPAFARLRELRARGVTTLGIAVLSAEAPPGLAEAADVTVDGPEGALEVLRLLAGE
jgi:trehalose 6-phosphate phosphatase